MINRLDAVQATCSPSGAEHVRLTDTVATLAATVEQQGAAIDRLEAYLDTAVDTVRNEAEHLRDLSDAIASILTELGVAGAPGRPAGAARQHRPTSATPRSRRARCVVTSAHRSARCGPASVSRSRSWSGCSPRRPGAGGDDAAPSVARRLAEPAARATPAARGRLGGDADARVRAPGPDVRPPVPGVRGPPSRLVGGDHPPTARGLPRPPRRPAPTPSWPIADLGCGRGELVRLLTEHGATRRRGRHEHRPGGRRRPAAADRGRPVPVAGPPARRLPAGRDLRARRRAPPHGPADPPRVRGLSGARAGRRAGAGDAERAEHVDRGDQLLGGPDPPATRCTRCSSSSSPTRRASRDTDGLPLHPVALAFRTTGSRAAAGRRPQLTDLRPRRPGVRRPTAERTDTTASGAERPRRRRPVTVPNRSQVNSPAQRRPASTSGGASRRIEVEDVGDAVRQLAPALTDEVTARSGDLGHGAVVEGDHRAARRQRLDDRQPEALELAREHQGGRVLVEPLALGPTDVAEQVDVVAVGRRADGVACRLTPAGCPTWRACRRRGRSAGRGRGTSGG